MKRYVTPATVIAAVALFVALAGSSFAAANYISGASIRPNSIPANRLTRSAIATLRDSRLPAAANPRGPISEIQRTSSQSVVSFKAGIPNTPQTADAACPAAFGGLLTGGGFWVANPDVRDPGRFVLTGSEPRVSNPSPTATAGDWHWRITGFNRDANAHDPPLTVHVFAVCVRGV